MDRGLQAEIKVLDHYTQQLGYTKLHHRLRTPFAEVDLVLRSPQGVLTIIEVKTCINFEYLGMRIKKDQMSRLKRVIRYFSEREFSVDFHYAVVSHDGKIQVFSDVFS
ncbi:MAG: hypothetical protein BroJett040_12400 [Oligoflexia bacterium]|nr:MAG: hypothetical protein BroJett040_12400 [Oligoflexia bacterium]